MVLSFNFEIYTCNPTTGESGWDIHFVNVFAKTMKEAKELLKKYPHFDCIILFNHVTELSETDKQQYAIGFEFRNVSNEM